MGTTKTIWEYGYQFHFLAAIFSLYATNIAIITGIAESSNSYCFQSNINPQVDNFVNYYCRANNTVTILIDFVFATSVVAIILHYSQRLREDLRKYYESKREASNSLHLNANQSAQAEGTNAML